MRRREIIKRVKHWQQQLGLSNWRIGVEFVPLIDKTKKTTSFAETELLATTDRNSAYAMGVITFDPRRLKRIDDNIIIHELLHVLFSDLMGYIQVNAKSKSGTFETWVNHYEERLISELERIVLRSKN